MLGSFDQDYEFVHDINRIEERKKSNLTVGGFAFVLHACSLEN